MESGGPLLLLFSLLSLSLRGFLVPSELSCVIMLILRA